MKSMSLVLSVLLVSVSLSYAGNGAVDAVKNAAQSVSPAAGVSVPAMAAGAPVFSEKSRIDCVIMVNGNKNIVTFGVYKLGTPEMKLLRDVPWYTYVEDEMKECPIFEDKNNKEINSLNAQDGDMRFNDTALALIGDGDGCSFQQVLLYKNTGYTRGWASESGSEVPHWYTKDVVCTVKPM
ncbi:MAG TPA: hypothetical protein PLL10_04940 [Elusimicrobiales bacterium]|nr:hypothetical protein [Elusimicrobiales bacterium]